MTLLGFVLQWFLSVAILLLASALIADENGEKAGPQHHCVGKRAVELLLGAFDRLGIPVETFRRVLLAEGGVDEGRGALPAGDGAGGGSVGQSAGQEVNESAATPAAELDQSPSRWDVDRWRDTSKNERREHLSLEGASFTFGDIRVVDNKYACYRIGVAPAAGAAPWEVWRRMADMSKLKAALGKVPGAEAVFLQLPHSYRRSFEPGHLNGRRRSIERFLQVVLDHPTLRDCDAFREFLSPEFAGVSPLSRTITVESSGYGASRSPPPAFHDAPGPRLSVTAAFNGTFAVSPTNRTGASAGSDTSPGSSRRARGSFVFAPAGGGGGGASSSSKGAGTDRRQEQSATTMLAATNKSKPSEGGGGAITAAAIVVAATVADGGGADVGDSSVVEVVADRPHNRNYHHDHQAHVGLFSKEVAMKAEADGFDSSSSGEDDEYEAGGRGMMAMDAVLAGMGEGEERGGGGGAGGWELDGGLSTPPWSSPPESSPRSSGGGVGGGKGRASMDYMKNAVMTGTRRIARSVPMSMPNSKTIQKHIPIPKGVPKFPAKYNPYRRSSTRRAAATTNNMNDTVDYTTSTHGDGTYASSLSEPLPESISGGDDSGVGGGVGGGGGGAGDGLSNSEGAATATASSLRLSQAIGDMSGHCTSQVPAPALSPQRKSYLWKRNSRANSAAAPPGVLAAAAVPGISDNDKGKGGGGGGGGGLGSESGSSANVSAGGETVAEVEAVLAAESLCSSLSLLSSSQQQQQQDSSDAVDQFDDFLSKDGGGAVNVSSVAENAGAAGDEGGAQIKGSVNVCRGREGEERDAEAGRGLVMPPVGYLVPGCSDRRFGHAFEVRSGSFAADQEKIQAGPAVCPLVYADLVTGPSTQFPTAAAASAAVMKGKTTGTAGAWRKDHVAVKGRCGRIIAELTEGGRGGQGIAGGGGGVVEGEGEGEGSDDSPFLFVVNFQIPGNPPLSFVAAWALQPQWCSPQSPEPLRRFFGLFYRFLDIPLSPPPPPPPPPGWASSPPPGSCHLPVAAAAAVGAGEAASRVDGAGGSYSPTSPCSPGRNSRGRDDEEQVAAALKGDAVAAGGVVVDVSVAGGDDMGKGGTEGGGGVRAEALSGRGAGMEKASASACSCPWEDSASEQSEGENAERGSKACTGAGDYCDGGGGGMRSTAVGVVDEPDVNDESLGSFSGTLGNGQKRERESASESNGAGGPVASGLLPTGSLRNLGLRLLVNVVEGPSVLKCAMPSSGESLLGETTTLRYWRGENYMEVDVDLSYALPALQLALLCREHSKNMSVEMGLVLQGETEAELPESVLGALRLEELDLQDTSRHKPLWDTPSP